jgi:hypothetical protein
MRGEDAGLAVYLKHIPPMKRTELFLLILFVAVTIVYFSVNFGGAETDRVFITITTFFFSIFTGFFISRQGVRYSKLREIISTFDGKMSAVYRASQNLSPEIHAETGRIIKDHYKRVLANRDWEHHFSEETMVISSIHRLLEEKIGSEKQESLRNQAIGRMLTGLADCQVLRKNMVMLYQERIPSFQWFLIIFFLAMLLITISVIPSVGTLLPSALKAAFAVSLVSIIIILQNLDNLHLFEGFIGENSARDVVGIIK